MRGLLFLLTIGVAESAIAGVNLCIMFHLPTDLKKKCDGHDVYVERDYSNNCAFADCPAHGINPASVGDSYRGDGQCWDIPFWRGNDNARNRQQAILGKSPDYFPECWWFGPDRTIDYTTVTGEPDCLSLHSNEDDQLACFCTHPVWESGAINDGKGMSMLDACCACGGGTDYDPEEGPPTPPPTEPPTDPPTSPPTVYTVPDGGLVTTLRFTEAFFDPEVHQSDEFKNIVKQAIAVELEVFQENVHILDIRSGSVIVEFYVSEESPFTAEEKTSDIARRIFEGTHTGINEHQYYGLSTASVESSSTTTSSTIESSSDTGLSVGIGIGLAAGLLVAGLVGYTVYNQRKEASANSPFVFESRGRY